MNKYLDMVGQGIKYGWKKIPSAVKILVPSILGVSIGSYMIVKSINPYKEPKPKNISVNQVRLKQEKKENIKKILEGSETIEDKITPTLKYSEIEVENDYVPKKFNIQRKKCKVTYHPRKRKLIIYENGVEVINRKIEYKKGDLEIDLREKNKKAKVVNLNNVKPVPMPEPEVNDSNVIYPTESKKDIKPDDSNVIYPVEAKKTEPVSPRGDNWLNGGDEYNLEAKLVTHRNDDPKLRGQKILPVPIAINVENGDYGIGTINKVKTNQHLRIHFDDLDDELIDYNITYTINGEKFLGYFDVNFYTINGKNKGITLRPRRDLVKGTLSVDIKLKNTEGEIEEEVLELNIAK